MTVPCKDQVMVPEEQKYYPCWENVMCTRFAQSFVEKYLGAPVEGQEVNLCCTIRTFQLHISYYENWTYMFVWKTETESIQFHILLNLGNNDKLQISQNCASSKEPECDSKNHLKISES